MRLKETLALTPALSPRRGCAVLRFGEDSSAVIATQTWNNTNVWKLFPLPEGEGKGEGKRSSDCHAP